MPHADKVTPQDIMRAANRYFVPQQRTVVLLRKKECGQERAMRNKGRRKKHCRKPIRPASNERNQQGGSQKAKDKASQPTT